MSNQDVSQNKTNVLAIVSLVTSLLGLAFIASIFGHIALRQIKRTGQEGRVLAYVGISLGYSETAVLLAIFIGMQLFVWFIQIWGNYYCPPGATHIGC